MQLLNPPLLSVANVVKDTLYDVMHIRSLAGIHANKSHPRGFEQIDEYISFYQGNEEFLLLLFVEMLKLIT